MATKRLFLQEELEMTMPSKLAALGFAALISVSQPAYASWQFTKWGMSEDQAASAAQMNGLPLTRQENAQTKEGNFETFAFPYAVGVYKFAGFLGFNAVHKLSYVHLELKEGNPAGLIGELTKKYGNPASRSPTLAGGIYVWRTETDQITWAGLGDGGFLDYQPRATSTSKGL